jgi:hypothetical protein
VSRFLSSVAELKDQYLVHISSGTAEDFAAYQRLCGTLEGLSMAEREVKEIFSRTGVDLGEMSDL